MKMNNKIMHVVLAVSLWAYPMTVVLAQNAAAQEESVTAISGTVASINMEEQNVVVEYSLDGAAQTAALKMTEETQILKDGEGIASSELKQGDKVSVEYRAEGDSNVITTLVIE